MCAPWDDELQKDLHIFPIVPNHKALRNPSHLQPNKNQQLHMYKLFISYIRQTHSTFISQHDRHLVNYFIKLNKFLYLQMMPKNQFNILEQDLLSNSPDTGKKKLRS